VLSIQDALVQIDPEREKYYAANAEAYVQALMGLDDNYAASLLRCELNDIIVSHDAFGYLARRYKFNVLPITGLSPEAEPSVRDLTRLANDARELGVKTIFFETLVSPELAETLAKEVGAETAVLNPLEGLSEEELAAGENYLLVMEKNRVALSSAMLCQ
jgi:zinc transport system substrate-binding protein